jgi:hypothetical protein
VGIRGVVSDLIAKSYRYAILAGVGWLTMAGSRPTLNQPNQRPDLSQSRSHQPAASPPSALTKSAVPRGQPREPCIGAEQGELSCEAIAARAAYDQARDADRQILIGWIQALGLGLSLLFSALATRAALKAVREAEKGAQASRDSVVEAKRSADAAERALSHSQESFDADRRPWLSLELDLIGKNYGDPKTGIWLQVSATIRNLGKIPAYQIAGFSQIVLGGAKSSDEFESMRAFCLRALTELAPESMEENSFGRVLFPNSADTKDFAAFKFPLEIQEWLDKNPSPLGKCTMTFQAYVTYKFQGSNETHITPVIYHMRGVYGGEQSPFFSPDPMPDRILLEPYHRSLPPT